MVTPLIKQTWTMSAVIINMFGQGLVLSYPSSLLPALNNPDSLIKADLHTASWIVSVLAIAGIPGFLMSSVLMAFYGRRFTHGFMILLGIIGWLLIYFAENITMLVIGRILCGLMTAGTITLGAIVIGEYTAPKYRGVFLCLKNATICMGGMFTHMTCHHLHWRTIALISVIPLFITLIIIYTWPESPPWLASKKQYKKSEEAFYWLRGTNEAAKRELADIIRSQKSASIDHNINSNYYEQAMNIFRKFRQRDFIKPFIVMMFAKTVIEVSGKNIFTAYALQIIKEITGETTQSFFYTMAIDIVITISALLSSIFVKLMYRRTLLFSTGFSAVFVIVALCGYRFLAFKIIIAGDKTWIPTSLVVVYFFLINLGCAAIPLALVGEIFPIAHRGVGPSLSGVWFAMLQAAGFKLTPHLIAGIGVYGFFAVLGSILGVCLLILYFIMPETKDKTLQEIEDYFNYGNYTRPADDDEAVNTNMI